MNNAIYNKKREMIRRSYWDIDDILAEEEPVSITISKDLDGVGFLDPSVKSITLKQSTHLTVPLWLAVTMALREMAAIEEPKFFGDGYRNILEADPRIVSLKERSNYFFEVGSKLSGFLDGPELILLLMKVFIVRVMHLFNEISHRSDPQIMKKLTEIELEIYEKGRKTVMEHSNWRERQYDKIRETHNGVKSTKRFRLS
jgi:GINS complex subunit 3